MKVLLVNGSPNQKGNTRMALEEVAEAVIDDGIDTGVCVFDQGIYTEIRKRLEEGVDGFVFGSPTYYAGPNGSLCSLMDRLFYSLNRYFQNRPAAAVGICRRAGAVQVVERLNKYFEITNMPVVTSQYWNLAFGRTPGEVARDDGHADHAHPRPQHGVDAKIAGGSPRPRARRARLDTLHTLKISPGDSFFRATCSVKWRDFRNFAENFHQDQFNHSLNRSLER